MSKVQSFHDGVDHLRAWIMAKLAAAERELGVDITVGDLKPLGGKRAKLELDLKLEGVEAGPALPANLDPEAQAFVRVAAAHGLQPTDIHREFVSQGTAFKITGWKATRPTFPISGIRVHDGKQFKFTVAQVKRSLGYEVTPEDAPIRRRRRGPRF